MCKRSAFSSVKQAAKFSKHVESLDYVGTKVRVMAIATVLITCKTTIERSRFPCETGEHLPSAQTLRSQPDWSLKTL